MRKGLTLTLSQPAYLLICSLAAALSLISTPANAQRPFRDRFSDLTKIDPSLTTNVVMDTVNRAGRVDTVLSLVANDDELISPETFVLSGLDRSFTNLYSRPTDGFSPQDIDYIPGQKVFVVTDANARRIYLIDVSNENNPSVLREVGIPADSLNLRTPVDAFYYTDSQNNRKIVITDQSENRVLQIQLDSFNRVTIDWEYGGTLGNGANQLSSPSSAVALNNGGQALICDTGNSRVILINTAQKDTVSSFTVLNIRGEPGNKVTLKTPIDVEIDPARRSSYLITDQTGHRVMLVDSSTKEIIWYFGTGQAGNTDNMLNGPTDADVIPDSKGNILICDAGNGNRRVIEVNRTAKSIDYRFPNPAHPLPGNQLQNLRDATRIIESGTNQNKTLIVATIPRISQDVLPHRLAYLNESFDSQKLDLGQPTDFDLLSFPANNLPAGTRVRLQLRSGNTASEVDLAEWYGPTGKTDFYTNTNLPKAINAVHDGHGFLQIRVFLDNNLNAPADSSHRLVTPVLTNIRITGEYFNTNQAGFVTSKVIQDSVGLTIARWRKIILSNFLPKDPRFQGQVFIRMRLLDAQGDKFSPDISFQLLQSEAHDIDLIQSFEQQLRGVQRLRLQAELTTTNSAFTPKLNDWSLDWEVAIKREASLDFTDISGKRVSFYRLPLLVSGPSPETDSIFILLADPNVADIFPDQVNLTVRATQSGDAELVSLRRIVRGQYFLNGFPAVVTADAVQPNNGRLEARNRDTLAVRYTDPTEPADDTTASAVAIQLVPGTLQVRNARGVIVDTDTSRVMVSIGDTLYVFLLNEHDRNFSPAQDSVNNVKLTSTRGTDIENIKLYEVSDNGAPPFDTGNFKSLALPVGIQASQVNDGKLQVLHGDVIRVEYTDLDRFTTQVFVKIDTSGGGINLFSVNKPFDFLVAPNPYHAKRHSSFRIGLIAKSVAMNVQRIEIYNFAGERIRSMPNNMLSINSQIPEGSQVFSPEGSMWWDCRTEDGSLAAAGTYWAKLDVLVTANGRTQKTTVLRKFVILH